MGTQSRRRKDQEKEGAQLFTRNVVKNATTSKHGQNVDPSRSILCWRVNSVKQRDNASHIATVRKLSHVKITLSSYLHLFSNYRTQFSNCNLQCTSHFQIKHNSRLSEFLDTPRSFVARRLACDRGISENDAPTPSQHVSKQHVFIQYNIVSFPQFIRFMRLLSIFQFELLIALVSSIATDITQWPQFADQRKCIQDILGCDSCSNVQNTLGCVDWACTCSHFSLGVSAVSSLAIAWCSATQDVAVATSIFEGFCGQYTNPGFPTGPPPFPVAVTPATTAILKTTSASTQGSTKGSTSLATVAHTFTPSTFVTSFSTTNSAGQTTMVAAEVTSVPDNTTSQAETAAATTGLTLQSKIALGIGLGIGFPSCLATLIGLFIKFREMAEKARREEMLNVPSNGPQSSSDHSTMEK